MPAALRSSVHDASGWTGRRVYLIGIGGSGMSGLARMLRASGGEVSGSDRESSEATDALAGEGIGVGFDQDSGELPTCDLVVASAAIKPDHPQMSAARRRGVRVLSYAAAVGECMVARTGVCVAGTHGKSTTTAMLGAALVDSGLDPTVIVGATCGQLQRGNVGTTGSASGTGFRMGGARVPRGPLKGEPGLLVVESCEYDRSFHHYHPRVASIGSVEADHLDIYGTLEAVVESFHEFARRVPSDGGRLLIAHEGAHRREVTGGLACAVETIGFSPEADWVVAFEPIGREVALSHRGRAVARWKMILPGGHNAINAATAAVLGAWVGADAQTLGDSLSQFRGVDRRMQMLGERPVPGGSVRVYDDYAHHPTEVDTTLRALREAERPERRGGRLVCVFQPHQHSRTRHLLDEFASSFSQADIVIVPEIYFVRDSEEERHKVTSADLVDRLRTRGVRALHLDPFERIVRELASTCRAGDVVVSMGAGPVWRVARMYLETRAG